MAPATDSGSEDEEVWGLLGGMGMDAEDDDDAVPTATAPAAAKHSVSDADIGEASSVVPTVDTDTTQEMPAASVDVSDDVPPASASNAVVKASGCCKAEAPAAGGGCCGGGASKALQGGADGKKAWAMKKGGRVPQDILEDVELNEAIASRFPQNYDFEIHRTIWRLRRCAARHVGVQMPEGLLVWAMALSDIFRKFVPSVEAATIFGDISFGACCLDDLAAKELGMDFLVHYGHSCLVPVDQTIVTMLYVHVEVKVDIDHLVETVCLNFNKDQNLVFMGTVQFASGIQEAVDVLKKEFLTNSDSGGVPQVKPLGLGETLGCTSPHIPQDVASAVFICDGRFHLESAMIQNPHVSFFRYDPYYRTLTREGYAHDELHRQRKAAIAASRSAQFVGLILGTLGRQGSAGILEELEGLLEAKGIAYFTLLLSEVNPERLALFSSVDTWVQVACPRLSLDWGDAYAKPLLTPFEAHVAFGSYSYKDVYPMDYYSNKGGPWSNYGTKNGHGGSLGATFHSKKHRAVEYEIEEA